MYLCILPITTILLLVNKLSAPYSTPMAKICIFIHEGGYRCVVLNHIPYIIFFNNSHFIIKFLSDLFSTMLMELFEHIENYE